MAAPHIGVVDYVVGRYYLGTELPFLAGLLFDIAAGKTRAPPSSDERPLPTETAPIQGVTVEIGTTL